MTPDDFNAAFAGEIEFLPLTDDTPVTTTAARHQRQLELQKIMANRLYGDIPPPPDHISASRQPIPGEQAERLMIEMTVAERRFTVDAALWLPKGISGPVPLICGLDFVGPIGIMTSTGFPIDASARISPRPRYGAPDKRLTETLRGTSAHRWPISMMLDAGYAVLISCYGSWVPDDADGWKTHGLYPFLGCEDASPTGAITLWAWALRRLLDLAATCDEIDSSDIAVAGHSRLGKAALWAAATDVRIKAVFANQSGCGGAAPAAHPVGETLAQMAERFPHWTIPSSHSAADLTFDQHHLLSLIAPRAVYLAGARADLWSDPIGSFAALQEAASFWQTDRVVDWVWPLAQETWQSCGPVRNGPLGYHLRPGGHDLLPYDWRQFLEFLKTC
jgi:hypothetical protein